MYVVIEPYGRAAVHNKRDADVTVRRITRNFFLKLYGFCGRIVWSTAIMARRENRRDLPVFIPTLWDLFFSFFNDISFQMDFISLSCVCVCVTWHDEHNLTVNKSVTWRVVVHFKILCKMSKENVLCVFTLCRACAYYDLW